MNTNEPINRVERRKLEFRDKITKAAIKLFDANGISNTSVASIIREADIAHKTFFNHFPTKDHLLQHVVTYYSGYAYAVFRDALSVIQTREKELNIALLRLLKFLKS